MLLLRRRSVAFLLLVVGLNTLVVAGMIAAQEETPAPAPHWTYEGEEGPEYWGEISEQFELCSTGEAQSPVDILNPISENLSDIEFNYQPSALTIKNNGHTIQLDYETGSSITVDGTEFGLVQFHFHHPSEHTIEGVAYPMELHFVHADADGNLAVVGVLLEAGEEDNPAFASVFENLPAEAGDPQTIDGATVSAADLLPADHRFYSYAGSLTTPPCSEDVKWHVLTTPVTLSSEQIERFAHLFELNARPTQPLNDRELIVDSAADS